MTSFCDLPETILTSIKDTIVASGASEHLNCLNRYLNNLFSNQYRIVILKEFSNIHVTFGVRHPALQKIFIPSPTKITLTSLAKSDMMARECEINIGGFWILDSKEFVQASSASGHNLSKLDAFLNVLLKSRIGSKCLKDFNKDKKFLRLLSSLLQHLKDSSRLFDVHNPPGMIYEHSANRRTAPMLRRGVLNDKEFIDHYYKTYQYEHELLRNASSTVKSDIAFMVQMCRYDRNLYKLIPISVKRNPDAVRILFTNGGPFSHITMNCNDDNESAAKLLSRLYSRKGYVQLSRKQMLRQLPYSAEIIALADHEMTTDGKFIREAFRANPKATEYLHPLALFLHKHDDFTPDLEEGISL